MKRAVLLSLGILAGYAAALHAEAGRTALGILTRSYGARVGGMGQTGAADLGDLDSMSLNPASLGTLRQTGVSATYQHGIAGDSFGYLNFGQTIPGGAIFAALSHLDAGTIDINLSDGTQGNRDAQKDSLGMIGVALGRKLPITLGVTGKFFKSELAETAKASGYAVDAGAIWKTPLEGLSIGGAAQNMGPAIQYESADDDLPRVMRGGIAYVLDLEESWKVAEALRCRYLFAVDAVKERFEKAGANYALEIRRRMDDDIKKLSWGAFRAGYRAASKTPSIGIGIRRSGLAIDYALDFSQDDFDLAHRFTLGYHFGSLD